MPPHVLLFPISSKGSFICIIPQTVLGNEVKFVAVDCTSEIQPLDISVWCLLDRDEGTVLYLVH